MRRSRTSLMPLVAVGLTGVLTVAAAAPMMAAESGASGATDRIAVLFVGHGEPAKMSDGDIVVTMPDGSPWGPHADTLDVPEAMQSTEWAAAYEEIATAMTYIFDDVNQNGVPHEIQVSPGGDVPPFFTYDAFYQSLDEMYEAFGDYSPHNDLIKEHIEAVEYAVDGVEVDSYVAFLDAIPRIADITAGVAADEYDSVVVVPLLLASSTHTQEVAEQVEDAIAHLADVEIVVTEPFFEVPYMRERIKASVLSMADHMRSALPEGVADEEVGVLLVSHGTPYVPAHSEFGWEDGEIFSNLILTEDLFHDEIASVLPWPATTGRMNYATPSIDDGLKVLEEQGVKHVITVPTVFPTTAAHTMWHVAEPAVGRAVTRDEGIVTHMRDSGMQVHHSALGYADLEYGRQQFRDGLGFIAELGVRESLRSAAHAGP